MVLRQKASCLLYNFLEDFWLVSRVLLGRTPSGHLAAAAHSLESLESTTAIAAVYFYQPATIITFINISSISAENISSFESKKN